VPAADPAWRLEVVRGGCGVPGCEDTDCAIPYGECHCGCGEPTALPRQTSRRLNLVKGEPQRYIMGHQGGLGLEARYAESGGAIAERRQTELALYDEGLTLEEIAKRVERSTSVVWADLRALGYDARAWPRPYIHPPVEPRECPSCGMTFQPTPAKAAVGKDVYCSRRCADQGRVGKSWKKVPLVCVHCGRERLMRRYYVEKGGRFCTLRCWGQYRAWRGLAGFRDLIESPHISVPKRQEWGGRWGGNTPPGELADRPRGRPRGFTSEQATEAIRRHEDGDTLGSIAIRTGMTKSQVDYVIRREKKRLKKV
jgi:hypothetical protein